MREYRVNNVHTPIIYIVLSGIKSRIFQSIQRYTINEMYSNASKLCSLVKMLPFFAAKNF